MEIKVYYLEMKARPRSDVPPPRPGLTVMQAQKPTVAFYRFLYHTVGHEYNWHSRGRLADEELVAILHDPLIEVQVLYVDGVPAGFAELDRRVQGEIELVQFGLVREFIGQGLGKYFLHWTVERAWSYPISRFWLHTCTQDHPAAVPNYLKAGFQLYKVDAQQE